MSKTTAQLNTEIAEALQTPPSGENNLQIAGAHVLAGAYRGKDIRDRQILCHAVSGRDIHEGRFKRDAGEAFCNRKIMLTDPYGYVGIAEINCPKCLEIVARLRGHSR